MNLDNYSVTRGIATLQFNPDRHQHATLKAFNEFIEQYEFRYIAQYHNHFHNILRLFNVLPNLPFTTSETKRDY